MKRTLQPIRIVSLVVTLIASLTWTNGVGAVKAPPSQALKKSTPILSMKAKPGVRSVSPNGANRVNVAAGLKKISMHQIGHAIEKTLAVPSAVEAAEQIFNGASVGANRRLTPMNRSSTRFSAALKRSPIDNLGFQHVRVAQTYQGIPIIGAEAIVHIDQQNQIYRVTGYYLPEIDIAIEPSISGQDALTMGMDDLKEAKDLSVQREPSLVIIQKKLAFHYVLAHQGPQVGQWHYYIDAATGDLILRYNNIQHVDPTGSGSHVDVSGIRLAGEDGTKVTWQGWLDDNASYYLINYLLRWAVWDVDSEDWEQLDSTDWTNTDPAAVSAGFNLAIVQDYVKTVLGFDSFDDVDGFAIGNVHQGVNMVNAFWDGAQLFFGDGDGIISNPLTVLDIVAHEFGHAIIDNTSNLIYQFESGALNEGYADILGALVEFWSQPDGTGSYPTTLPGQSDWLLGEDAWLSTEALRNLRDPISYGYPSYYKGTNWHPSNNPNDNYGVHTNSGVIYHAFYLLAQGGSGSNDGNPYDLTGIGITDAGAVAMRANNFYHTPTDGYRQARQAWIDAATDLGVDPAAIEAVFDAVGVFASVSPSGNLINDGSFESGPPPSSAWMQNSLANVESIVDPVASFAIGAFDGAFVFWAGGYANGAPDTNSVEQTIAFPADAKILEFAALFYRTASDDADPDFFTVSIEGTQVYSQEMSTLNNTFPNYQTIKINISPYAGQTVNLRFEAQSAGTDTGNVLVDYIASAATATTLHAVTFSANSGGRIVGMALQDVPDGTDASAVTAQPDNGFEFDGWTGGYTGNDNPLTLTNVTADMSITANFTVTNNSSGGSGRGGGGGGGSGCFIDTVSRQE